MIIEVRQRALAPGAGIGFSHAVTQDQLVVMSARCASVPVAPREAGVTDRASAAGGEVRTWGESGERGEPDAVAARAARSPLDRREAGEVP
jgi:hypothetical protein